MNEPTQKWLDEAKRVIGNTNFSNPLKDLLRSQCLLIAELSDELIKTKARIDKLEQGR